MKILITGASSGIGQATAYKFATAGADLILTYSKNKSGAETTQKKCLELGAKSAEIFKLDLSDNNNILDFTEKIIKQYKNIDILINNAGHLKKDLFANTTYKDIDQHLQINLIGLIKLTHSLLPLIQKSIINIGSNLALRAKPKFSLYSVSKHGVLGFTKSLALEKPNLNIFLINPSGTATRINNFRGENTAHVAELIFKISTGKIKSGTIINLSDYRFGVKFKKPYLLYKFFKKIIKL